MPKYMLTVYTISTTLVTTDAENYEEAQKLFDQGGEELSVLTLPETTWSFVSEARKEDE